MKKYLLPIVFVLSLAINAFFIGGHFLGKQRTDVIHSLYDIKPVSYDAGIKSLFGKLEEQAPQVLKERNYAFIYTWDTLILSDSRLRHIFYLDSLFATPAYAAMDKLLLSELPQDAIETYIQDHRIRFKSFTIISNADDFISAVFTLKKAKAKSRPMQAIINRQGRLLHYKAKLSGIEKKDSTLYYIQQIARP